jgi:hypothetical protein
VVLSHGAVKAESSRNVRVDRTYFDEFHISGMKAECKESVDIEDQTRLLCQNTMKLQ